MNELSISVEQRMKDLLKNYPAARIAEEKDSSQMHDLFESVGMKLSERLELVYSRRPDLFQSYRDSHQRPIFFMDQDKSILAVLSETSIVATNQIHECFYASDLRVTAQAKSRNRKLMRLLYTKILKLLDRPCYTTILKNNKMALNALTSKTAAFKYNLMFSYVNRIVFTLPGFNRTSLELKCVSREEFEKVYNEKTQKSDFAHRISGDDFYFLYEENERVAGFCIKRPKNRSILIRSKSIWIKFLLGIMKISQRKLQENKLPWVYLSYFFIEEKHQNKKDLISSVIRNLRKNKIVKAFELVLMSYKKSNKMAYQENEDKAFFQGCPQFVEEAMMYQVESTLEDREIKTNVYLDSSQL